jgi:hypothetical protein
MHLFLAALCGGVDLFDVQELEGKAGLLYYFD